MEMVKERTEMQQRTVSKEEQEHNERINERYLQLKNKVDFQVSKGAVTITKEPVRTGYTTQNPMGHTAMYTQSATLEQAPQVKEYTRRSQSPLFTTDRLEQMSAQQSGIMYAMPTMVSDVAEVQTPECAVEEEVYSLTTMAKLVLAVFATLVIGMLSLISLNSQTLAGQSIRIQELNAQRQVLVERNQEVLRTIEEAKSEETIRQYAESQGMIQLGE